MPPAFWMPTVAGSPGKLTSMSSPPSEPGRAEAILLALAGGAAGVLAGAAATAVYAHAKGWAIVIPVEVLAGSLAAALLIGAAAGLLPAIRAVRLSPTQALWSI